MAKSRIVLKGKGAKYKNKKVEIDGRVFDSKKEAARYLALRGMAAAGLIQNLELQAVYRLEVEGKLICKYRADFRYKEGGAVVVEDVKGVRTEAYRLKRKLMAAIHRIEIKEI